MRLHLPFAIAGALQGVPFLVLAPHLGPFIRLFFAQGSLMAYFCPPLVDSTDNSLSTCIHMYMFDSHFLLASGSVLL